MTTYKYRVQEVLHPTLGILYKEYRDTLVDDIVVDSQLTQSLSSLDLEVLKDWKKQRIDEKTQEIIFRGFTYGGLNWSLSLTAQINWTNILHLPEEYFPLQLQCLECNIYNLPFNERLTFYTTAVEAKNSALQSGHILKTSVTNLLTKDEVITFEDPRT